MRKQNLREVKHLSMAKPLTSGRHMILTPRAILSPVWPHCLNKEFAQQNNPQLRIVCYPTTVKWSECCLNQSPTFYCNKEADTGHFFFLSLWATICRAISWRNLLILNGLLRLNLSVAKEKLKPRYLHLIVQRLSNYLHLLLRQIIQMYNFLSNYLLV